MLDVRKIILNIFTTDFLCFVIFLKNTADANVGGKVIWKFCFI